jgi:hypothetical protein
MDTSTYPLSEDAFIKALSTLIGETALVDYEMVLRHLTLTTAHLLCLGLRSARCFPDEIEARLAGYQDAVRQTVWMMLRAYDDGSFGAEETEETPG